MNDLVERESKPGPEESSPGWFWPVLGLAIFLSVPYYFSLETFFSHDDFVILWFHKDWPLLKPWAFFQTDVLTFYRPLQDYALAVLFHFFDMIPFPYCVVLVAIHLANIVLFGRMVDRLFESRPLTFLATMFFAANWQYWEVVSWKGCYGTALSWLFAMGACNLFVDHLRDRRWLRYLGAFGLAVGALLSKETAINLPLLFCLIYWVLMPRMALPLRGAEAQGPEMPPKEGRNPDAIRRLFDFVRLLLPFFLLVGAYVIFYFRFVRDVYTWIPKGYEWQGPVPAIAAVFHAMTFWLVSAVRAAVEVLVSARPREAILVWFAGHAFLSYILPLALVAAAVTFGNRRLAFGIIWSVFAFFPANFTPIYDISRYYYGAVMGVAIIWAELFLAADRAIVRRWRFPAVAASRVAGCLVILFFVHANLFLATSIVNFDNGKCREIEDLYHFLVKQRGYFPSKTLFEVRCVNRDLHFHEGMGLREMFKLALEDDSIEAILPDQRLANEALTYLLRDYPKPVLVLRDRFGRHTFRVPVPKPTIETPAASPSGPPRESSRHLERRLEAKSGN